MRADPSPEPRLEHVYVRRSGPGGGGGQPNSPVYAQIAKKRNSNNSSNSSVAERIAQFEYQSKEIVRDSSPAVDQVPYESGFDHEISKVTRGYSNICTSSLHEV